MLSKRAAKQCVPFATQRKRSEESRLLSTAIPYYIYGWTLGIPRSSLLLSAITHKQPYALSARFRRRLGFSSVAGLSTFTPASSGSIIIRPQYSHTIIFLRIRTSN